MSIKEQEHVKRFLKYYCTIIALIIGITCGFFVFYTNFNKSFEYPEKEYQQMDHILKQVVDVEHKSIKYDLEVPDNMKISFRVMNNKPSVEIRTTCENEVHISSYTYFNVIGEPVFERDFQTKEELNRNYKNVGILFAFLVGTICFLGEMILLIPIKKYVILLGTRDEYEAVRNSYLMAGENVKHITSH